MTHLEPAIIQNMQQAIIKQDEEMAMQLWAGFDDDERIEMLTWAWKMDLTPDSITLNMAQSIKSSSAELQRMLGCLFIDACGKLPWNDVQQWRALSDCSMYSKDALLEALRYNKLDNCEQLWTLFKDKVDVRLLCDMVAEAAAGICAEGILWAMDQADDDDQKFQMVMRLCHFHWDKINKMEAPLIEGLSQRFSAEQIKDVLSIAQYHKTLYFQDDKMEIMTPFLNAVLARIEHGVLTSHINDAGLDLRKGLKL